MNLRKAIVSIVLLCIAAAAGIYAYAYQAPRGTVPSPLPGARKVAPATIGDGSYFVRVHSIVTAGEDTSLTFTQVTYLDGSEAASSAMNEVDCPDDRPIEACVPTLTKGYYVRESAAAAFTAPVTSGTRISLRDNPSASIDGLRSLDRQFDPVFEVVIKDGSVYSLTERSPL